MNAENRFFEMIKYVFHLKDQHRIEPVCIWLNHKTHMELQNSSMFQTAIVYDDSGQSQIYGPLNIPIKVSGLCTDIFIEHHDTVIK